MKLYVARHGQTEWNVNNRVCGVTDVELTAEGMEQAKTLSTKIIDKQIDIIVSSPLLRAKQTARIISDRMGRDFVIDNRLSEQNYGVYEGVLRDHTDFMAAKSHFPHKMFGGESILQVAQRVYNFIDEITENHAGKRILAITHGGICRVIHSYFCHQSNEEYYAFHMGNCELNEFHTDQRIAK